MSVDGGVCFENHRLRKCKLQSPQAGLKWFVLGRKFHSQVNQQNLKLRNFYVVRGRPIDCPDPICTEFLHVDFIFRESEHVKTSHQSKTIFTSPINAFEKKTRARIRDLRPMHKREQYFGMLQKTWLEKYNRLIRILVAPFTACALTKPRSSHQNCLSEWCLRNMPVSTTTSTVTSLDL